MSTVDWQKTVAVADVEAAGGMLACPMGNTELALFSVEGEIYATSNICTHGSARLSQGYLIGELIECPLHQGLFDVRTGAVAGPPCSLPLQTFPVRIEDGMVLVGLPKPDAGNKA